MTLHQKYQLQGEYFNLCKMSQKFELEIASLKLHKWGCPSAQELHM